jgi:hypothetical protein
VFGPVNHGLNWKGWERSGEKVLIIKPTISVLGTLLTFTICVLGTLLTFPKVLTKIRNRKEREKKERP